MDNVGCHCRGEGGGILPGVIKIRGAPFVDCVTRYGGSPSERSTTAVQMDPRLRAATNGVGADRTAMFEPHTSIPSTPLPFITLVDIVALSAEKAPSTFYDDTVLRVAHMIAGYGRAGPVIH